MGFYKRLKLKEFFLWCTDVGRLGVQLWDVFLVCKSVVVYVHHLKYPAL
jgi:hypothetical protein